MNTKKFYICKNCGNLVHIIHNTSVPVMCCKTNMQELIPNSIEIAFKAEATK